MPPRPPVTTLVIHTWKEHGKPRPLSNQEQSTQAARDRISRSLSHEAHLVAQARPPEDDILLSTQPHCCSAVIRSTSVEEGLLAAKYSPVVASPMSSTPQLSDDDSETSFGVLPALPPYVSTPEDNIESLPSRSDDIVRPKKLNNAQQERGHDGLPPLPSEWPLCHRRLVTRGIPPKAVSVLLAENIPIRRKARRERARSASGVFERSLLGDSMIQGSSSFDAGLSDVAHYGILQSGISPNL